MAIKKRNGIWHIDFFTPNGERVRRTAGTENKQQAQELHDKLKAEAWRVVQLGDKPKYKWEDAVVRYLTEQSEKRSLVTDKFHLRWVDDYLRGKILSDINKSSLEELKAAKLKTGVSNTTVNRMISTVRKVLNSARKDWDWIDSVPSVRMLTEPKGRIRWLTREESKRLLTELPTHLNLMARFSLATGLRERNVTRLQWSQIDLQRRCAWIDAEQSKSKRAISVPLNDDALTVVRSQIGKHPTNVFSYNGEKIETANTRAWRAALKRAGIENFRWHDLRHTWASWHVQSGTPLHILKELGGWADLDMVLRYAHLSSDHLSGHAANIENRNHDTNTTQAQKNLVSENRYKA